MHYLVDIVDNNIFWIVIWIGVFITALVIELSTEQLVSIWFCGSSIISLILAICNVLWWIQLICFVVTSAGLLIASKFLIKRDDHKNVPTNVDSLIGKEIKILKTTTENEPGEGKVRDVVWTVYSSNGTIQEGETAIIEEIEGNHLKIKKKGE